MKLQTETTPRKVVPIGRYKFTFLSVEEADKPLDWLKPGDDPKQWVWKFSFDDLDGDATEQWGFTSRTLGMNKDNVPYKARQWVEAFMGRAITGLEASDFDSDQLEGKQAWASLSDVKKNGEPGNVILGFTPYEPGKPKPSNPKPPALEVEDLPFDDEEMAEPLGEREPAQAARTR